MKKMKEILFTENIKKLNRPKPGILHYCFLLVHLKIFFDFEILNEK